MATYVIEYKKMVLPYSYEYDSGRFTSVTDARKRCISLIEKRIAVLGVVRGMGKEQLVYTTVNGGYVLEDRVADKWYRLNKNGSLGAQIKRIKDVGIVQSARQRW